MLIGSDFVHYIRTDDERKGNASGNSYGSGEGRQLAKNVETLDSLTSEDAIQTVLASQLKIHISKYYFVGPTVDTCSWFARLR